MTERLYYTDATLTRFTARVLRREEGGARVVLDRTAFYPTSGGQPNDGGTVEGIEVLDVQESDEEIIHVLKTPLGDGGEVTGEIDWARRFDHMQQHSGQHLLSAVFEELYGMATVSFHMGAASSTIDLEAGSLEPAQSRAVERRANELVCRNLPVGVTFEDAALAQGLRKPAGREGEIRVVTIEGTDRSACGGTHVRHTGEIGLICLRRQEKIRGNVRVEFLCGLRAAERARQDYEALSQIARHFSATLEDAPGLVAGLLEQAKEADKRQRKLSLELAGYKGRELHAAATEGAGGLRRHVERRPGGIDEELRAVAQGFCAQPGGLFIALCAEPASLLVAASAGGGIHAGEALKSILGRVGGRGGGNAQMAQGSLPGAEALEQAAAELAHL